MRATTALTLGRISNLPTIWTNCLVGFAITNTRPDLFHLTVICLAFSLLYTAGMYLNDVFDYHWDKIHQPGRPIAAGEASRIEVSLYGTIFLIAGVLLVYAGSESGQVPYAVISAFVLVGCILLYDWKHKVWAASPWLMGCCRLLVYWTVALTVAPFSFEFLVPGLCLMGYISGITYLARTEHINKLTALWPIALLGSPLIYIFYLGRQSLMTLAFGLLGMILLGVAIKRLLPGEHRSISQSVSYLLAGICLIDGLILVGLGNYVAAISSMCAFFLSIFLQKYIRAT